MKPAATRRRTPPSPSAGSPARRPARPFRGARLGGAGHWLPEPEPRLVVGACPPAAGAATPARRPAAPGRSTPSSPSVASPAARTPEPRAADPRGRRGSGVPQPEPGSFIGTCPGEAHGDQRAGPDPRHPGWRGALDLPGHGERERAAVLQVNVAIERVAAYLNQNPGSFVGLCPSSGIRTGRSGTSRSATSRSVASRVTCEPARAVTIRVDRGQAYLAQPGTIVARTTSGCPRRRTSGSATEPPATTPTATSTVTVQTTPNTVVTARGAGVTSRPRATGRAGRGKVKPKKAGIVTIRATAGRVVKRIGVGATAGLAATSPAESATAGAAPRRRSTIDSRRLHDRVKPTQPAPPPSRATLVLGPASGLATPTGERDGKGLDYPKAAVILTPRRSRLTPARAVARRQGLPSVPKRLPSHDAPRPRGARDAKGVRWLKLSLPMRPNGRWAGSGRRRAATPVDAHIVVDLSARKLRVVEAEDAIRDSRGRRAPRHGDADRALLPHGDASSRRSGSSARRLRDERVLEALGVARRRRRRAPRHVDARAARQGGLARLRSHVERRGARPQASHDGGDAAQDRPQLAIGT